MSIYIDLDNSSSYIEHQGRWSKEDNLCPDYIKGYHCTRLISDQEVKEKGLLILSLERQIQRVKNTLVDHGASESELNYFYSSVRNYNNQMQREGKVAFCLNRFLFEMESGCERFFKYFGGEAIYRAFENKKENKIERLLRKTGSPMIVHCNVPFHDIADFQKDEVINYINGLNDNGCEAYITHNLRPKFIELIEKM